MAIKKFKTESKRLLDLMANSIYTNTDIFLRELISNASDAIDKRYYLSLTDTSVTADDLKIKVACDKKARTITISDNGIGMSKEELENNLGTIAKSGSLEFKENLDEKEKVDIIGQFGVGFYSAFMVADKIEVTSFKVGEEKAYKWIGTMEGYEVKAANKDDYGSVITLYVKENTKEKKYDDYLDSNNLQVLIKKYSDFIRYPIVMDVEVTKEDKTEIEEKTINSMVPIWKKAKKDLKEEDYNEFYSMTYYDFEKPLKTLHYKVEGNTSYSALLYIPSVRPFNYYSTDYKMGLKLYSKGVFIKDEAKELVSDYFRFVRGVVDSDDLSLNISREILQEDYQMTALKKSIDKKIKSALVKMLENERETYEKFFEQFGTQLKFGTYDNYGMNKDELIDLLIFKSSKEDKYVTLKEYVERMKEDQKDIYYATGETIEAIKELPQLEKVLDKGYEVLYFTDNVDEFMANIIGNYSDKPFKSLLQGDLDLDTKEEKEEVEKKANDNKDLLATLKEELKDKVSDVKLSTRLKTSPVCLVSDDGISINMAKTLNAMNQGNIQANKILEINPDHELFKALAKVYETNKDLSEYANLLYDQALLIAGLTIEDPLAYTKRVSDLMLKALER
ncbi:MAG: molecular chaperone HtpG [Solobacterium sp.]|nr:molecular chaperone HtpG [Solobacterium sp.]MCI7157245.1 molecular chaperone HtpG [Solobacterium sp.]MCI7445732.1 molecular chaperone HtpG [Solobacterium sp.]MDY3793371.1 molecular chaperone HtpG [Erysipelotrichaceae bacterium]